MRVGCVSVCIVSVHLVRVARMCVVLCSESGFWGCWLCSVSVCGVSVCYIRVVKVCLVWCESVCCVHVVSVCCIECVCLLWVYAIHVLWVCVICVLRCESVCFVYVVSVFCVVWVCVMCICDAVLHRQMFRNLSMNKLTEERSVRETFRRQETFGTDSLLLLIKGSTIGPHNWLLYFRSQLSSAKRPECFFCFYVSSKQWPTWHTSSPSESCGWITIHQWWWSTTNLHQPIKSHHHIVIISNAGARTHTQTQSHLSLKQTYKTLLPANTHTLTHTHTQTHTHTRICCLQPLRPPVPGDMTDGEFNQCRID